MFLSLVGAASCKNWRTCLTAVKLILNKCPKPVPSESYSMTSPFDKPFWWQFKHTTIINILITSSHTNLSGLESNILTNRTTNPSGVCFGRIPIKLNEKIKWKFDYYRSIALQRGENSSDLLFVAALKQTRARSKDEVILDGGFGGFGFVVAAMEEQNYLEFWKFGDFGFVVVFELPVRCGRWGCVCSHVNMVSTSCFLRVGFSV